MYHMPGCIAGQLATAQPLDSSTAFYVSKVKRLHAYFLAQLIKAVLYHFFIFWRGLYSLFSSSRRSNIHHIPNSGIQNASTTKRDMFISLKYNKP